MKHFVTLAALLTSLSAFAQLPYNPDENGDGLIGVVDLQGLLANYGNEFASAVVSEDGESALVYVGEMGYYECKHSCNQLPGFWSLPSGEDLVPVFSVLNAAGYTWTWLSMTDFREFPYNRVPFYTGHQDISIRNIDGVQSIGNIHRCYCAAKQLPRVEYSYCAGGDPSEAAFNQCISDKLAEGWYPLDGFPNHHDYQGYGSAGAQSNGDYRVNTVPKTHASFWRWAE